MGTIMNIEFVSTITPPQEKPLADQAVTSPRLK
jgi:hypothetical protein